MAEADAQMEEADEEATPLIKASPRKTRARSFNEYGYVNVTDSGIR